MNITADDVAELAASLNLEPAHVLAVARVECGPWGPFMKSGHPVILFEPRQFQRLTGGAYDIHHQEISANVDAAGSLNRQLSLLARARCLDNSAAVQACSWGAFQIMGFNYALCGHANVLDFEVAMCRSFLTQLESFGRFLESANLTRHLRAGDWAAFARGYNGPAFERHGYHTRLQDAYLKALDGDGAPE